MKLVQKSTEVFVVDGPIAIIGHKEIGRLRAALSKSAKGRVRINAHASGADRLHEMFIAIEPNSYIRPHKHPTKSESFHLVYGAVDVVVFEDDGKIHQIVELGANDPNRAFYYRMSEPFFHTLIIRSDFLIVHEITNGPFEPTGTVFANFAPDDSDVSEAATYQAMLLKKVEEIRGV